MRKWLSVCALLCMGLYAAAQDSYNDKVKKYVDTYNELAIQEQLRSGIPAAITLGQGILETEAGCSELATNANNHFGIKCKKEWKGETFAHTDDAPNECFRKYGCAGDSYKDHSDYLKSGTRYAALFKLSTTDYAAWAFGLKRCGYATNPIYAQKLIKIIEDFELQEYTYKALNENQVYKQPKPKEDVRYAAAFNNAPSATDSPAFKKLEEAADEARATIFTTPVTATPLPVNTKPQSGGILKINGLKAFKAYKGDMLLQYAIEYSIRYEKLLEYNDLTDAPLATDMYLYLEKKPTKGKQEKHIVQPGETMWQIAQDESMQLQRLLAYNLLQPGEEAATGTALQLQHYAGVKPKLNDAARFMDDAMAKKDAAAKARQNDYIVKEQTVAAKQEDTAKPTVTYNDNYTEKPDMAAQPATITKQADETTVPTIKTPDTSTTSTAVTITTPTSTPETKETIAPAKVSTAPAATIQTTTEPEPQDELSRLKARLDKVVYAGDDQATKTTVPAAKTAAPVATIASAPKQEEKKLPLAKQGAARYYTVKKGDTAFNIAKRNDMTVAELLELNGLKKGTVEIGQRLRIK